MVYAIHSKPQLSQSNYSKRNFKLHTSQEKDRKLWTKYQLPRRVMKFSKRN